VTSFWTFKTISSRIGLSSKWSRWPTGPTADLSLDLVDDQDSVDLVGQTRIKERAGGDADARSIEVVEDWALAPKS